MFTEEKWYNYINRCRKITWHYPTFIHHKKTLNKLRKGKLPDFDEAKIILNGEKLLSCYDQEQGQDVSSHHFYSTSYWKY